MDKYLITGGAGFIGSHIAEELIKRGHSVRVIDNCSTGKRENLYPLFGEKMTLWQDDILDYEACVKMVQGMDFIIHQAALPSVPRSIEDPLLTTDVNIRGTLNMLLASRDARIRRFIFASSSSVYGNDSDLPRKESDRENPMSPYAISKLAGEYYCKIFNRIFGLYTICLRYFNIFGPRQNPNSQYAPVIPSFISKMLKGESPLVFGDGEQTRDFTYVSNAVNATILASTVRGISGKVFNIACGVKTSVNSLASSINEILRTNIVPYYAESHPADARHSSADISEAREALKYEPSVPFDKGLERTVRWYMENK